MLDQRAKFHLDRLKAQTTEKMDINQLSSWMEQNLYLGGKPYSFEEHEYHKTILDNMGQVTVMKKCSQIGASTLSIGLALGACALGDHLSLIYVLPTQTLGNNFSATRINPMLQESPALKDALSKEVNNTEARQIGSSFLYMRSASAGTTAISVPADFLVLDETDQCDQDALTSYQSRLTHSKIRRQVALSTPTVPNFGIDKLFNESARHFLFTKCDHCNHIFLPNYHQHVVIPGYDDHLDDITKRRLTQIRWREAKLLCPHCGKEPNLGPEHRMLVCENTLDGYDTKGFQMSPFDFPSVITPSYLIEASTRYDRRVEFYNQNLGIALADESSSITDNDLDSMTIDRQDLASARYVIGCDMGLVCAATVLAMLPDGRRIVVETKKIPISSFERDIGALKAKWRTRLGVFDAMPYVPTILAMQNADVNAWAAYYITTNRKSTELFTLASKDEQKDKGKLEMRVTNINRDLAMDNLMFNIRAGDLLKFKEETDAEWREEMKDMVRAQIFREGELVYTWQKNTKKDHAWHSLLYANTAADMIGVASHALGAMPLASSFKLRKKKK